MIEIFLLADQHGSAPGALTGPEKNLGLSPENRRANTRAGERKRKGDTNKSDIVRPKPPEPPGLGSAPRPEPASTAWYGIALHYLLPSHRPVSFGGSTKIKDCGTSPAAAQIFFSPTLTLLPLNRGLADSNASLQITDENCGRYNLPRSHNSK